MSHKFSIYNFVMIVPPRYRSWWILWKPFHHVHY